MILEYFKKREILSVKKLHVNKNKIKVTKNKKSVKSINRKIYKD